jgi:hypothetical protein
MNQKISVNNISNHIGKIIIRSKMELKASAEDFPLAGRPMSDYIEKKQFIKLQKLENDTYEAILVDNGLYERLTQQNIKDWSFSLPSASEITNFKNILQMKKEELLEKITLINEILS